MTYAPCLSRRQALRGLAVFLAGSGPLAALAATVTLPSTASLADSLDQALHGCAFCKVVRENYLQPLRASGLQVVQVDMRDSRALLDFDGTDLTHDAWVRKQGIKLAPTVLFFGAQGREVATRLKGAYLPDFYGAYLDEQLALARRVVAGA